MQPSLSFMILDVRPQAKTGKEAREQFELIPNDEPGSVVVKIREEIGHPVQMPHSVRVSQGPATMIHAGRITDCTCHQVNGDQYAGTVSYEVPKLYRGKFDYVAKRNGGKWQITELSMSAYKVHLVRGEDGKWNVK